MSIASNEKKFVMRMPVSMHARIKAQAVKNRRSMNSEMLVLLEVGQLATTTCVQLVDVDADSGAECLSKVVEKASLFNRGPLA